MRWNSADSDVFRVLFRCFLVHKGDFSAFFSAFSTTFNYSMKILGRFFVRKFKKATVMTINHIVRGMNVSDIGNF